MPTMSASSSAQAMPSSIEPVMFITTTSGMATAPTSEPIETSISPAITTMPTPMPAIIANDAWPITLVMLRVVRKVGGGEGKERDEDEQAEQQHRLVAAEQRARVVGRRAGSCRRGEARRLRH